MALFDGNGDFIDNNDDGSFPDVGIDPVTGEAYDTFFQDTLNPGNYTVAISQFNNFFSGGVGDNISLGFLQQGNPTFTSLFGCSAGIFCDFEADSRTNEWAFDVLNVNSASAVPEPLTILGAATAVGFGASFKRKLAKKHKKDADNA